MLVVCAVAGGDLSPAGGGASPTHAAEAGTIVKRFPTPPTELQVVAGTLLFVVDVDQFSGAPGGQLWRSDGTAAGTTQLPTGYAVRELVKVDELAFFVAKDGAGRDQLWRTDGSAAGTVPLTSGTSGYLSKLTSVGEALFFIETGDYPGFSLVRSDGTAGGTAIVKDVNDPNWPSEGGTLSWVDSNGVLFFNIGNELWKSDGSSPGTVPVYTGLTSPPRNLFDVRGSVIFSGTDAAHGAEPWITDGTTAGTRLLKDTLPGEFGGGFSSPALAAGAVVYNGRNSIWRTDGTSQGTVEVKSNWGGPIRGLTGVNGTAFFQGYMNTAELWKTDGTAGGTVQIVTSASLGFRSPLPRAALQGSLLFQATDAQGGALLYLTDGTAGGTRRVQDGDPEIVGFTAFAQRANTLFYATEGPAGDGALRARPLAAVAQGTQGTVGPSAGASLAYTAADDTHISIELPAGAVAAPTTFVYRAATNAPLPPGAAILPASQFSLTAFRGETRIEPFVFQQPIRVTVQYTDAALGGLSEQTLTLRYWSGAGWADAATTCSPPAPYTRDAAANRFAIDVCHLTDFAVFGAGSPTAHQIFLPLTAR